VLVAYNVASSKAPREVAESCLDAQQSDEEPVRELPVRDVTFRDVPVEGIRRIAVEETEKQGNVARLFCDSLFREFLQGLYLPFCTG